MAERKGRGRCRNRKTRDKREEGRKNNAAKLHEGNGENEATAGRGSHHHATANAAYCSAATAAATTTATICLAATANDCNASAVAATNAGPVNILSKKRLNKIIVDSTDTLNQVLSCLCICA